MSTLWGNETVIKLIELYQSHGMLWDTSHCGYKNKILKNDAWEDIAESLELPRKDVEAKIHSLRSQFLREKKKISASNTNGSERDDVKVSSWFAYEPLKFLLSGATTSGGMDTLQKQTQRQESYDQYPEYCNTSLENSEDAIPSGPSASMETSLPTTWSKSSRKRTVQYDEKLEEAYDVIRTAKIRMLNSIQDEFTIYGQYVGSELREVNDEHSVLMAKSYINNILIDARMGRFRRECSNVSSSILSESSNHSPEQTNGPITGIIFKNE